MNRLLPVVVFASLSCTRSTPPPVAKPVPSPESLKAENAMLRVEAGPFQKGSTAQERDRAYEDYLATRGTDTARNRQWFQYEPEQALVTLPGYWFDAHPVTQAAYGEFIANHPKVPAPTINAEDWKAQGFVQPYNTEVARFNWHGRSPARARLDHPVVLVSWQHASAYCQWRGSLVGKDRHLPSAEQFEKAARGPEGSPYPWGPDFAADRLNSAVQGPRDTTPVTSFPNGRSAVGAYDMAGNVFQWTSTPWPRGKGRMTVKGSAWDDHGGLGRAASAHGRRATVRHAIVGFRCAGPLE